MTLPERFARIQQAQDPTLSNELEVFKALSFEDQCHTAVAFGKAHLGKKFLDVWHQEPRWLQWVLKNYEDSKRVEHLKLFHFVQVMLEQEETGSMPKPVNKGYQASPKPKAKGKSSHHMPETENHAEAIHHVTEEDKELWDITSNHQVQGEVIEALQARMLHVENALTEILTLLRPHP